MDDKSIESLSHGTAVCVIVFIATVFIGLFVIFLGPIYKMYKKNKAIKYYGIFLIITGLICSYPPLSEWFYLLVMNIADGWFSEHLSRKLAYLVMDTLNKGLLLQIDYFPWIMLLAGVFCFIKGHLCRERKSEKISADEKKSFSIKKLKKEYEIHLEHGLNNSLYLGRDHKSGKKLYLHEREGHLLCVGATRTGKTSRVLIPAALSDFFQGNAVLNIDPKGSLDNMLAIYKIIKMKGMEKKFKVLILDNPEISTPYNPLRHGNISQIAARVMKISDWSEEFYKNQCYQDLIKYLAKMNGGRENDCWGSIPTLNKIYEIFEKENNPNTGSMVANLCDFHYSDFAPIFNFENSGIDFLHAQQNGEFIYVIVNTDTYLEASRTFIRALLLDLMWCASQVHMGRYYPKFFSIHIDEISDFIHEGLGFESFMKKCGGAGYCLHCYSQSFGDLKIKGLQDMMISNTFNHIVLRQNYPENADLASKIFGTVKAKIETEKTLDDKETGYKSVRSGYELKVDPTLIKELDNGAAIFHNRSSTNFIDLAVPPNYTKKGYAPFVSKKEKKEFISEITDRANCVKSHLNTYSSFDPENFILSKKRILESKNNNNFHLGRGKSDKRSHTDRA